MITADLNKLPTHRDSAEEILRVLSGTAEVTVGAETARAGQGTMVLTGR